MTKAEPNLVLLKAAIPTKSCSDQAVWKTLKAGTLNYPAEILDLT